MSNILSEELKEAAISWAQRQPTFPKRDDWVIKKYILDPPPFGYYTLYKLFGSYNSFRKASGVGQLIFSHKDGVTLEVLQRDCIINENGCWVYQKYIELGYARKTILGKNWRLHRYVHHILGNNPPPSSKHSVDHSCRNRACINPDHLRWATPSEQGYNQTRSTNSKPLSRPPDATCLEDRANWYFQQSTQTDSGCLIPPLRPSDTGYARFRFNRKQYRAHIISALQKYKYPLNETYYESFTKDNIVLHKCNNRMCCNPAHLEIGNGKIGNRQNSIDSRSYHPGVKLKDTDIPELREIYSDCLEMGWTKTNIYNHIGSIYNVSPITVRHVLKCRSWKDI